MLSYRELEIIGRDASVEMMGRELVEIYSELCCSSYGMYEDFFWYDLGMDTEVDEKYKQNNLLNDEEPIKYHARVKVNPETGEVTLDYKNSNLPNMDEMSIL